MYKKCIICESSFESLSLNGLEMRKCKKCGLVWRRNFDLSVDYYSGKKVDLSYEKIHERIQNAKDRIKTFKKYTDLNNLCDIGCGEGIFIRTLQEEGYKNVFGIEPNLNFLNYARQIKAKVFKGTINDFPIIAKNKKIQIVTLLHLVEHLKDPRGSLELLYSNMQKGAKLILEIPDINAYCIKKAGYKHKLICLEHFFYFNTENIQELLKEIGFKILAYGKRDFNQYNLSIKESLFRLGFPLVYNQNRNKPEETKNKMLQQGRIKNHFIRNLFKISAKKILSRIVILSGRLNYIWVIAEK